MPADADPTIRCDTLVMGAGMAGATAAGRLAGAGRQVLLVEKAATLGGSAVLSGGKVWTAPDRRVMRQETPGGDPRLCDAVLESYAAAIDWIRSTGAAVTGPVEVLRYGRGYEIDVVDYVERCAALVERAGGWVVRDATVTALRTAGGRVVGAEVVDRDGPATVDTPAVVLASGGFPADPELRCRHLHDHGRLALARSNPCSVGDGLRLGQAAGGATSSSMDGFYGHLICWPLPEWGPTQFRVFAQGHSDASVLVNRAGHRFVDESLGDHQNAQAVLAQPAATALMLSDHKVRVEEATFAMPDGGGALDKFQLAIDAGAHVAAGDTWAEALEPVAAWGFDPRQALDTIEAYNTPGVAREPSRRGLDRPLDSPPFYATEVVVGVTATHGGLRVDDRARVLGADDRPVPGLYAAGADAGNAYGVGYAGGLAFAATFAVRATDSILGASAAGLG